MVLLDDRTSASHPTHERVISVSDKAAGLEAIIAIHSTARGPAFGGCRVKPYPSRADALRDALRLSEAMSRKSAMAGLPFGGGKCVVIADPATQKTDAMLRALAEAIHQLGGSYLTADDSGTSVRDMEVMREITPHARGFALHTGEACPAAAYGTFLALRAAVEHRWGLSGLGGVRVAVQGLGNLGMRLCAYLSEAGAELVVADPRRELVERAALDFGAEAVSVDRILSEPVDVLSPNAFEDVICDASLPLIRAGIVVGGANNQLQTAQHGLALHQRRILYVPDYIANAGGVIDVAMEGAGYSTQGVLKACEAIAETTTDLLEEARRRSVAPSQLADELAAQRMGRTRAMDGVMAEAVAA
ncbi:Glu/Leu/Phe/Val dehydrogenase dimerization domain-containing protein [Tabrizicola sp.]|uniref:Leu/Phe/Val dehydrogenase n=1 Tax=Tabrizicola sp. TaxID=2005166 RepID=UPI0025CBA7F5|nr:Glu/Leu/Phe/Val dehydrogenase dimerization domain-containing protein [Tabrizicola sp.]